MVTSLWGLLASVGVAAVFWAICKTRNNACFRNKLPTEPLSFIFLISHWMNFWALFQGEKKGKCSGHSTGGNLQHNQGWRPGAQRIEKERKRKAQLASGEDWNAEETGRQSVLGGCAL